MKEPVYIIDSLRTPFLKAQSKTGPGLFTASELAVQNGKNLLLRNNILSSKIDEVILGCAVPSVEEANIARVVSLRIGCDYKIPAWTVMRNCASGLQALATATNSIDLGRSNLILAGGTESLSHSPLLFSNEAARWLAKMTSARDLNSKIKQILRFKPSFLSPIIGILKGLTDPNIGLNMGQTAENLATKFSINRDDADHYSLSSHEKSIAHNNEILSPQISTIYSKNGLEFNKDDGLRTNLRIDDLKKLKPVFDRPDGTVTAGNSSQVTDGSCLFILASESAVKENKLSPIGAIIDYNWAGLNPAEMGLGPIHAFIPLLKKNKLKKSHIDIWEINEAFASQVIACQKALDDQNYCKKYLDLDEKFGSIDESKLNVAGGAISIGHPVGASGARLVLNLLHILKKTNGKKGIASLCIGGGQGGAMLIESYQ